MDALLLVVLMVTWLVAGLVTSLIIGGAVRRRDRVVAPVSASRRKAESLRLVV